MDALMIAVRVIHFAAAIALFGEFVFVLCIARRDFGAIETLNRSAPWYISAALASGILWLGMQTAAMSGAPLDRALDARTLGTALTSTLFGRVWIVHSGLAIALGAAILLVRYKFSDWSRATLSAGAVLAGVHLATLAGAGHGAAERGAERIFHLSADSVHLLAAGAWLGALAPLAFSLLRARHSSSGEAIALAAQATRRFSTLGVVSVGALVVTGIANTWYTVGSVPAMFGTDYGRLLFVKLLLFGAMVVLAGINRMRLIPRIANATEATFRLHALRTLARNAIAEAALGLGVVGVVGALGIAVPAAHVQTIWPFAYTLDWNNAFSSSAGAAGVSISLAGAIAALVLIGFGARARRWPPTLTGAVGLVVAITTVTALVARPAFPTTYLRSPVPYNAASIASGARLYEQNCLACHGSYGYGDGPAANSLPVKPANLTEHLFHHREGDLFWWLQHGIAGSSMPGFGDRIGERQLWDLVNFVYAQSDAEKAKTMSSSVARWQPILAPNFVFQIGSRPQESLAQEHGRVVLLAFYSLPGSLARLHTLSEAQSELDHAGARVIAMSLGQAATRDLDRVAASLLADPDPAPVAAYMMYRRRVAGVPAVPHHIEFLIDRGGYLRARWTPGEQPGWDAIPQLLSQIGMLNGEKPHAPAGKGHVH